MDGELKMQTVLCVRVWSNSGFVLL